MGIDLFPFSADPIQEAALLCFIVGAGLVLGSFAGALVYRFDKGLPFAWDKKGRPVRSICPPCGRTLTPLELIPVASWVIQRGRCRCGKMLIPWTYPVVELSVLSLVLLLLFLHGWGVSFIVRSITVPFILASLIVAIRRFIQHPLKKSRAGGRALGRVVFWVSGLLAFLFLG